MRTSILVSSVLGLALVACNKPSESGSTQPTAPEPGVPPNAAPAAPAAAPAAAAPSDSATAGGLHFRAPKPFEARKPKSSMRAAEFGLAGDSASELAVFYFGPGEGGSVEANMTRWIGQFKKPDGTDAEAKRGQRSTHGIEISTVEAVGNYGGGMAMPGAPAPSGIGDAMLLGGIAKGPEGAVFFKFVGPRGNVEAARGAFDQLLESIER